jgi:hypothetical protein
MVGCCTRKGKRGLEGAPHVLDTPFLFQGALTKHAEAQAVFKATRSTVRQ